MFPAENFCGPKGVQLLVSSEVCALHHCPLVVRVLMAEVSRLTALVCQRRDVALARKHERLSSQHDMNTITTKTFLCDSLAVGATCEHPGSDAEWTLHQCFGQLEPRQRDLGLGYALKRSSPVRSKLHFLKSWRSVWGAVVLGVSGNSHVGAVEVHAGSCASSCFCVSCRLPSQAAVHAQSLGLASGVGPGSKAELAGLVPNPRATCFESRNHFRTCWIHKSTDLVRVLGRVRFVFRAMMIFLSQCDHAAGFFSTQRSPTCMTVYFHTFSLQIQ